MYQHGLRVKEVTGLLWEQVDLDLGQLHVTRVKHGVPGVHAMSGEEIRAWRRLKREQQPPSAYCFTTERKGPLTPSAVRKLVERAGRIARLPFAVHPHMLRHGCGFKLAADSTPTREIQQHLGHKSISSTVVYTQLAPGRRYWR
jgi:type 1 fimbriae regulatory protein FimB/type 1 fimbriae regulatory protein FimE